MTDIRSALPYNIQLQIRIAADPEWGAGRIEELEAKVKEMAMEYLALEWQAQEALDECVILRGKLEQQQETK